MLRWTLVLLSIAAVAFLLGAGGVSWAAQNPQVVFWSLLLLAVVGLAVSVLTTRRIPTS